ncbi:MAG: hypothetical protein DCC67_05665 [Planctomycetota bacterium]|nr:MAG: hypothetical protein DCC67_05665 [Planctomycetota bacterium]
MASFANLPRRPQHGANVAATARFGSFPLDFLAPVVLMVKSNAGIAPATIFGNREDEHEQETYRMSTRP